MRFGLITEHRGQQRHVLSGISKGTYWHILSLKLLDAAIENAGSALEVEVTP